MTSHNIESIFATGCEWITTHQQFFSIPPTCAQWIGAESRRRLKRFAESVIVADVLLRSEHGVKFAKSQLKWAWSQLDFGNNLRLAMISEPSEIFLYQMCECFNTHGYSDQKTLKWVSFYSQIQSMETVPKLHWHKMGFYNSDLRAKNLTSLPTKMTESSWLLSDAFPWTFSVDLGYAITHEIFYLSDFGFRDISKLRAVKAKCELWMPTWCEISIEYSNWDLLAELVLCHYLLGMKPEFKVHEDQVFAHAMSESFFAPPVEGESNYHTLLVILMLIAKIHRI